MEASGSGRYGAGSAVVGQRVILIGGTRGPPGGQGVAPDWQDEVTSLDFSGAQITVSPLQTNPALRQSHRNGAVVQTSSRVYMLGGETKMANVATSDEFATLTGSTISGFTDVATGSSKRVGPAVATCNGQVYLTGGFASANPATQPQPQADVQVAQIDASGILGSFSPGPALPAGRAFHASVCVGGQLLIIGGIEPSGGPQVLSTSILRAPLTGGADGGLGAFAPVGSLPRGTVQPGAYVGSDGKVYVFGGFTNALGPGQTGGSPQAVRDVFSIALDPDGGAPSIVTLPNLQVEHGAPVVANVGGTLAVIGGATPDAGNGLTTTDIVELETAP